MTKRTEKEIENDVKKLKEAAITAKTIKELETATGLSYSMIKTTLSKHPRIFKRIKDQLTANKEKAELEAQKQKELQAKAEEKAKSEEETKTTNQSEMTESKKNEDFSGFVIDASITGIENLREMLSKICLTESKIILTSITIKELGKMQKFEDIPGKDAAHILAMAAENPNNYESVLIDETLETPDDCIVNYCANNKEKVTLLTADKEMALKARMYSVKVQYFKQPKICVNSKQIAKNNSKVETLFSARRVGNQLLISNLRTDTKSVSVYTDGIEYNDGIRELKIGDDVFIATKKPDYITFAHYRMISLDTENNCELIYSKRIYDKKDIDLLKAEYKPFVRDFKRAVNL